MDLAKNCQICNYKTFLTFVDKETTSCFNCCKSDNTICINERINEKEYEYIYCNIVIYYFVIIKNGFIII